jgi:hypothetical protein
MVLLHYGGFCNGSITKRILLLLYLPSEENRYYSEHDKNIPVSITISFYQRAAFKQDRCFVMQPLQNPPLYVYVTASMIKKTIISIILHEIIVLREFFFFLGGGIFFILYSALLYLPPLRFHCADGCWDRTQDCCSWCIGSQTL